MTKKTTIKTKMETQAKANKPEQISNLDSTLEGPHSLLHSMDDKAPKEKQVMKKKNSKTKTNPLVVIVGALVIVLAGSITGFGLSKAVGSSGKTADTVTGIEAGTGKISDGEISKGDVLGNPDKKGDEAEGVLEKGGINGEGSHKLLRPGGPSQTVYLTSSVVDLDQLVGHEVKVWGDTFAAQSAGWLMDVVTLEVVNLDAAKPFEEE